MVYLFTYNSIAISILLMVYFIGLLNFIYCVAGFLLFFASVVSNILPAFFGFLIVSICIFLGIELFSYYCSFFGDIMSSIDPRISVILSTFAFICGVLWPFFYRLYIEGHKEPCHTSCWKCIDDIYYTFYINCINVIIFGPIAFYVGGIKNKSVWDLPDDLSGFIGVLVYTLIPIILSIVFSIISCLICAKIEKKTIILRESHRKKHIEWMEEWERDNRYDGKGYW